MTKILSGTYSSLYTLSNPAYYSTTITATGLLNAGLYAASLGAAWMITNTGSVLGAGITLESAGTVVNTGSVAGNTTSGTGVLLTAGGSVTNQSAASVSGFDGIVANGTLTVLNAGSIAGNITAAIGIGILLNSGGSVTNLSSASISGFFGISGQNIVTVVNAGTIAGYATSTSGGVAGRAMQLVGGSVTNQSSGTISGDEGIIDSGAALTVVNAGRITGGSFGGIILEAGSSVTNQSSASISGFFGISNGGVTSAPTVVNYGGIAGNDAGIEFTAAAASPTKAPVRSIRSIGLVRGLSAPAPQ